MSKAIIPTPGDGLQFGIDSDILDDIIENTSDIVKNSDNIMLNAFRIAINGALTIFNMIDGFVDEYEDESGIDNLASINEQYDATDDFYKPGPGDVNSDTKLMLHLNGLDGATSTTDASPSAHTVNFLGTAQLDTAEKKWGVSSLLLDGDSDDINMADSSDWDFGAANDEIWTIDFQVKHTDHAGTEVYFAQFQQLNYFMGFRHVSGAGMSLFVVVNDVHQFTAISNVGEITDTNWHHIMIIFKGNGASKEIGLYKDGIQIGYSSTSNTWTLGGELHFGSDRGIGDFFEGHFDEIRVQKSNPFGASPNVGLTDVIAVPTGQYTDASDMTLISESVSAEADPNNGRIVILEEDVSIVTLNTDLLAYISKDDGATWAQITLEDEGDYDASKRILVGNADLDVSGIGSGTDMKYKLVTANGKDMKIHGTALRWGG